jgi:hypothetical protein
MGVLPVEWTQPGCVGVRGSGNVGAFSVTAVAVEFVEAKVQVMA